MKTTILFLTLALTLIIQPTTQAKNQNLLLQTVTLSGLEGFPASSEPTLEISTESPKTNVIASAAKQSPPILGIGKPKYNKNRIDRKNSVSNKNRRAKRIQRRFGIGYFTPTTMSLQTGILTLNPLLA